MILTGREIEKQVRDDRITIHPFDSNLVNPNSYNYRLSPALLETRSPMLDAASGESDAWLTHLIPDGGYVLQPNRFYLGTTMETIGSGDYVPLLIGRSSMGRLGMFLQISADLGHLGAVHKWTLEIVVVQPLRVYAGMKVGQVSFWVPTGEIDQYDGYFGKKSDPTVTPGGYNIDDSHRT